MSYSMVLFSNLFLSFFKNWPEVKISSDQIKVTGGPVIRFFYLRNNFFIFDFFQFFEGSHFGFLPILTLQFFIVFQIVYFFS